MPKQRHRPNLVALAMASGRPSCNSTYGTVVNAMISRTGGFPAFYIPPLVKTQGAKIRASYEQKQRHYLKTINDSIAQANEYTAAQRRALGGSVTVLRAVDGYNHTETIERLLESGLRFHGLSTGAKKWGKLATFLTKYRTLQHQVRHGLPYMVQLEEDVLPDASKWHEMMAAACEWYEAHPSTTILQLSRYAEVMVTSLAGARELMGLIERYGILRSDDQQLLNAYIMGTRDVQPTHATAQLLPRPAGPLPKGYKLARMTNSAKGHIFRTRRITWAEMALLRLISDRSGEVRTLPSFGNPEGFDFWTE